MTTHDCLALLLAAARRYPLMGDPESSRLAGELVSHFGSLRALFDAPGEWNRFPSMTRSRRELLDAVSLLLRESRREAPTRLREPVQGVRQALERLSYLAGESQEVVAALFLDARNGVLGRREIFRGTLTDAPAQPREILRAALEANAATFVLAHNHPSGCPQPSEEDIRFTARLKWAAANLGVPLADHLIVGEGGSYFSFAEAGLLNKRAGAGGNRRPRRL